MQIKLDLPFDYHLSEFSDRLERFFENASLEPFQLKLCKISLAEFMESVSSVSFHPWFHLPLLPYVLNYTDNCIHEEQYKGLVVAIALIYMGLALDDHVADNELRAHYWQGVPRDTVQWLANNLSSSFATLAINQLQINDSVRIQLLKMKAKYKIQVLQGQQLDLQIMHANPWDLNENIRCFSLKTGKCFALSAVLSCILMNLPDTLIEKIDKMCTLIGTMAQIRDDYRDLYVHDNCADLENGLYTFPIVYYTMNLLAEEKEKFISLLKEARDSYSARKMVSEEIKKANVLQGCLLAIALLKNEVMETLNTLSIPQNALEIWMKVIDAGTWGVHNPINGN